MQCNLSLVNCDDHAGKRKINIHGHAVQLKINTLSWPCSAT